MQFSGRRSSSQDAALELDVNPCVCGKDVQGIEVRDLANERAVCECIS